MFIGCFGFATISHTLKWTMNSVEFGRYPSAIVMSHISSFRVKTLKGKKLFLYFQLFYLLWIFFLSSSYVQADGLNGRLSKDFIAPSFVNLGQNSCPSPRKWINLNFILIRLVLESKLPAISYCFSLNKIYHKINTNCWISDGQKRPQMCILYCIILRINISHVHVHIMYI